jgi:CHAT domain-containing protein
LRLRVLGEEHPDYAESMGNLAALSAATQRPSEAWALLRQVGVVQDRLLGKVFAIGSERQRLGYLDQIRREFYFFLSLAAGPVAGKPGTAGAALDLVVRRKGLALEAMAVQRDAVLGGRRPALAGHLRELSLLRMQLARRTLAGPGPEGPEAHLKRLAEWTGAKEHLEAELACQIPEMNLEQKLQSVDRQVVASALPEGVVLIEFVRFHPFAFEAIRGQGMRRLRRARYLAFVLPAGEPDAVQMLDLGEAEPIDRMIASFRSHVVGEAEHGGRGMPSLAFVHPGATLRAALFDPLVEALGGRRRLFLAPDGALTRLPFEVLPTGNGGHLLDEYHISYLGSGRDLLRFGAAPSGVPHTPLVVADPDFDLAEGGEMPGPAAPAPGGGLRRHSRDLPSNGSPWPRLAGTKGEGERVARLLRVTPWLGADALEGRVKAVRSPSILHVATHGFFLADQEPSGKEGAWRGWMGLDLEDAGARRPGSPGLENPLLRSGVVLAGANTWHRGGKVPPGAEDGYLTAEDVSGLDLLDTNLVVLSACNTGLGEILTGEGVFGLRRAFVVAGAKTLVMSLWKVPDDATQELMVAFYHRLLEGQPRSAALRGAQLAVKAKYPHPFYT